MKLHIIEKTFCQKFITEHTMFTITKDRWCDLKKWFQHNLVFIKNSLNIKASQHTCTLLTSSNTTMDMYVMYFMLLFFFIASIAIYWEYLSELDLITEIVHTKAETFFLVINYVESKTLTLESKKIHHSC